MGRGLTDISLIVPHFSSAFKAPLTAVCGIDEAGAINDCPARNLIWSYA